MKGVSLKKVLQGSTGCCCSLPPPPLILCAPKDWLFTPVITLTLHAASRFIYLTVGPVLAGAFLGGLDGMTTTKGVPPQRLALSRIGSALS